MTDPRLMKKNVALCVSSLVQSRKLKTSNRTKNLVNLHSEILIAMVSDIRDLKKKRRRDL